MGGKGKDEKGWKGSGKGVERRNKLLYVFSSSLVVLGGHSLLYDVSTVLQVDNVVNFLVCLSHPRLK